MFFLIALAFVFVDSGFFLLLLAGCAFVVLLVFHTLPAARFFVSLFCLPFLFASVLLLCV